MPNKFICDSFNHNPFNKPSSDPHHWHVCNNSRNITGRCGFSSVNDTEQCPLASFIKQVTVLQNPGTVETKTESSQTLKS